MRALSVAFGDSAVAVQGPAVTVRGPCGGGAGTAVREGQHWGQQWDSTGDRTALGTALGIALREGTAVGTALEGNAGQVTPGEHHDLNSAFATGTCSADL